MIVAALTGSRPFLAEANGFAGTPSDGLVQLDSGHRIVDKYGSAADGNVTQTALVDAEPGQPFTLALGFGAMPAPRSPLPGSARASRSAPRQRDQARREVLR